MFERILFICLGNICRSPTAEGVLKYRLSSLTSSTQVASAGLSALVGKPAASKALSLLQAKKIDITSHRARQLTKQMIMDADLILTMEWGHKQKVEQLCPTACGKVFLLGKWSDFEVIDPYGGSISDYEYALDLIEKGIEDWLERLWKH